MRKLPPTWLRPQGYEFPSHSTQTLPSIEGQKTDDKATQILLQQERLAKEELSHGNDVEQLKPKKMVSQKRQAVHIAPVPPVVSKPLMQKNVVQLPLLLLIWSLAYMRGLV